MKRFFKWYIVFSGLFFLFLFTGCKDENPPEVLTPEIISFSPESGLPGTVITITGNNFGSSIQDNEVYINDVPAIVTEASVNTLKVTVPENATSGKIELIVNNQSDISSTDFIVESCKVISSEGSGYGHITSSIADNSGNTIVTGKSVEGTFTIGNTSISQGFIGMYNHSDGFIWIKEIESTEPNHIHSVTLTNTNEILVTGRFGGDMTLGNTTLTSDGNTDVFVAKYDIQGQLIWAKKVGGPYQDYPQRITVDPAGDIWLSGKYTTSIVILDTTLTTTESVGQGFIAKFDRDFNFKLAFELKSTGNMYNYSICTDDAGNLYYGGVFTDDLVINGTTYTSKGEFDLVLAKFSSTGESTWGMSFGSASNGDRLSSMKLDPSGNIYISGYFMDSFDFGSTVLNGNSGDCFTAKFSTSGSLIWSKSFGTPNFDSAYDLDLDEPGNVYSTGYFKGEMILGNDTLNSVADTDDIFVVKQDPSNGEILSANQAGGSERDRGLSISINSSGDINVLGTYHGTAEFGNCSTTYSGIQGLFFWEIPGN